MEVVLLTDEEIAMAARIIRDAGASFAKTGTGWAGATTEHHIEVIKAEVGDTIPLKVAGGVRSLDTLLKMRDMGVSRFGIGYKSALCKKPKNVDGYERTESNCIRFGNGRYQSLPVFCFREYFVFCIHPLSSVFIPYSTCFPQKDWQEQAPEDWWEAVVCSTRQLLKQSSIPPEEIVSLAISGHSLGVVPIGKDGRLLRKTTPIWSDQRATQEAEDFFTRIDYQTWYEHTGNGFPPACYSVFKIMWYRNHEPEIFAKIHQVIV